MRWIEIKLGKTGKTSKVVVSGFRVGGADVADPQTPPKIPRGSTQPAPQPSSVPAQPVPWTATGWTRVVERVLDPKRDNERIILDRPPSASQIAFVLDGSVEISQLAVEFITSGPGLKSWRSQASQNFDAATRSKALSISPRARAIAAIRFVQRGSTAGTKLELWIK